MNGDHLAVVANRRMSAIRQPLLVTEASNVLRPYTAGRSAAGPLPGETFLSDGF